MIQVMGEKDFYEYQKGTYKVHSTEWTQNKAKLVLDAWEKEFTRVNLIISYRKNNLYFYNK